MAITNRIQLKEYTKKRLGAPIINIELDNSQMDILLDDTIELYSLSHYDGSDLAYITVTLTAGENKYTLSNEVQEVLEIMNKRALYIFDEPLLLSPYLAGNSNIGIATAGTVDLEVMRQAFKMAEHNFQSKVMFNYNQTTKELNLLVTPKLGDYIICEAYVSNTDYTKFFRNKWFKDYYTAVCKYQWGQNLGKYNGAQMIGGATLDYTRIISEAQMEIDKLELELQERFQEPPSFYIG